MRLSRRSTSRLQCHYLLLFGVLAVQPCHWYAACSRNSGSHPSCLMKQMHSVHNLLLFLACSFARMRVQPARHTAIPRMTLLTYVWVHSPCRTAGVDGEPVVFLFCDTQIVQEGFLEDINNMLNSGEGSKAAAASPACCAALAHCPLPIWCDDGAQCCACCRHAITIYPPCASALDQLSALQDAPTPCCLHKLQGKCLGCLRQMRKSRSSMTSGSGWKLLAAIHQRTAATMHSSTVSATTCTLCSQ